MRCQIVLTGCSPEPLASYLKSLALLRLVSEQKDSLARGWWERDVFYLELKFDEVELIRFFLEEYRPTPIVAVDPHVYGTEGDLRENLAHFGMSDIVQLVVAPSVTAAGAWKGPVRVVFVDGHHEQASVEADVDAWLPFLAPG